jgi:integrator complex subunit 2
MEVTDASGTSSTFSMKHSELFDHLVYLSEVCDVLAIAMAELPNLLSPSEVAEALLRLKYGPYIICHIVANQPDCFSEGIFISLITLV